MIQLGSYALFTQEAIGQRGIVVDLGMWHFYRNRLTGQRVDGAEYRGHAARCHDFLDLVVIQQVARMDFSGCDHLEQPIRPTSIKTHLFHRANTNDLHANIIMATRIICSTNECRSNSVKV